MCKPHHWVIEPPTGPISKGMCKLCGAEQEFANFADRDLKKFKPSNLVVPIGDDSLDLIQKLIEGRIGALNGINKW